MNKTILTFVGSADDLPAIQELARHDDVEVVAVALDLDGVGLRELHDQARAAGARRCHAIDVREDFARECVLPAARASADDAECDRAILTRARAFIERRLADIAAVEGAADVLGVSYGGGSARRRSAGAIKPDRPALLQIAFAAGTPVTINGIPMSIAELLDCAATVAAAHGVPGVRGGVHVVRAAYSALRSGSSSDEGIARLEIEDGEIRPMPVHDSTS